MQGYFFQHESLVFTVSVLPHGFIEKLDDRESGLQLAVDTEGSSDDTVRDPLELSPILPPHFGCVHVGATLVVGLYKSIFGLLILVRSVLFQSIFKYSF